MAFALLVATKDGNDSVSDFVIGVNLTKIAFSDVFWTLNLDLLQKGSITNWSRYYVLYILM